MASYTAPKSVLTDVPRGEVTDEALGLRRPQRIIDREDDYRKRRLRRALSPERHDAFAAGSKTPDVSVRTYADVMREEMLKRDTEETLRLIAKKRKTEETEPNRSKPASTREVRGRESEVRGTRTKPASTREIHGFRESEVMGNRTKPTSTRDVHSRFMMSQHMQRWLEWFLLLAREVPWRNSPTYMGYREAGKADLLELRFQASSKGQVKMQPGKEISTRYNLVHILERVVE
ncbi:hypothetical protein R1sor_013165 [Riccia sorocarpa]|uniref:Uncharacterized protein n=1 Tax=Riccia sorocarpa TaxID=122646 RepID=A0ABD3H7M4_9MARC